jgi:hypothetical protein
MPEFAWGDWATPPNPQNNGAVGRNLKMVLPVYFFEGYSPDEDAQCFNTSDILIK